MFDHVQIKVKDFASSRKFYEQVLSELGYKIVLEFEDVVGIGNHPHEMFEVSQADENRPLSQSTHIAFVANSREAVQKFHSMALAHGAQDNGQPGFRDYEDGYYAAFVIDPNGHNLEAVFSETTNG
jgi:predicted lactoylglutathione lyase